MPPLRPAVVLLSGGLDSATVLALARDAGFAPFALSFDYGQRHGHELDAARTVAEALGAVRHETISIDLTRFGGSALTAGDLDVPKHDRVESIDAGIPITYVPARNTVFLSLALAWAEVLGASDIFIGVNAVDYSGYPDCRPEFIAAFEAMANLATKRAVEGEPVTIHAPLMTWSKADIIRKGVELGVDYGLTTSCYDPGEDGKPCTRCDSCLLRAAGFRDAEIDDPRTAHFAG